jgi:hypothetical protein
MIRAAMILTILASPAAAQDAFDWPHGSYVRLQPTEERGAVAEVEFRNLMEHKTATLTFALELDGLRVEVVAVVGNYLDPDTITVRPPDGFFAVPEELSVPENETGKLLIYATHAVGF